MARKNLYQPNLMAAKLRHETYKFLRRLESFVGGAGNVAISLCLFMYFHETENFVLWPFPWPDISFLTKPIPLSLRGKCICINIKIHRYTQRNYNCSKFQQHPKSFPVAHYPGKSNRHRYALYVVPILVRVLHSNRHHILFLLEIRLCDLHYLKLG